MNAPTKSIEVVCPNSYPYNIDMSLSNLDTLAVAMGDSTIRILRENKDSLLGKSGNPHSTLWRNMKGRIRDVRA